MDTLTDLLIVMSISTFHYSGQLYIAAKPSLHRRLSCNILALQESYKITVFFRETNISTAMKVALIVNEDI